MSEPHSILSGTICCFLQLEIVNVPVGLGVALSNNLFTQSLYLVYGMTPKI